jgi:hypothetical protein
MECGRPVFCAFVSRSRCREGQATLDVGPNEVRTEQPCCYVARHISLVLGTCRSRLGVGARHPSAAVNEGARLQGARCPRWVHERARASQSEPGRRPPHRRVVTIRGWFGCGQARQPDRWLQVLTSAKAKKGLFRSSCPSAVCGTDMGSEIWALSRKDVNVVGALRRIRAKTGAWAVYRLSKPFKALSRTSPASVCSRTPTRAVNVAKLRPIKIASESIRSCSLGAS